MSIALVAAVSAAGALGAAARFAVEGALTARRPAAFPYPTLAINVAGSLLLGVVTGLVLFRGAPDALRVAVGTGFCGGFTTFSTTSVAAVQLGRQRRSGLAVLNVLGTLALTVLAAALGLLLTL